MDKEMEITVWDKDIGSKDDFMGRYLWFIIHFYTYYKLAKLIQEKNHMQLFSYYFLFFYRANYQQICGFEDNIEWLSFTAQSPRRPERPDPRGDPQPVAWRGKRKGETELPRDSVRNDQGGFTIESGELGGRAGEDTDGQGTHIRKKIILRIY